MLSNLQQQEHPWQQDLLRICLAAAEDQKSCLLPQSVYLIQTLLQIGAKALASGTWMCAGLGSRHVQLESKLCESLLARNWWKPRTRHVLRCISVLEVPDLFSTVNACTHTFKKSWVEDLIPCRFACHTVWPVISTYQISFACHYSRGNPFYFSTKYSWTSLCNQVPVCPHTDKGDDDWLSSFFHDSFPKLCFDLPAAPVVWSYANKFISR